MRLYDGSRNAVSVGGVMPTESRSMSADDDGAVACGAVAANGRPAAAAKSLLDGRRAGIPGAAASTSSISQSP